MWNKPHLLNAIADLLMLVAGAALLAAAAVWLSPAYGLYVFLGYFEASRFSCT